MVNMGALVGILLVVVLVGAVACTYFVDYNRNRVPPEYEGLSQCEWINLARTLSLPYWKKEELLRGNYTPEVFESYMYTLPLTRAESAAMYVEGYDVESFTERFLKLSWVSPVLKEWTMAIIRDRKGESNAPLPCKQPAGAPRPPSYTGSR